MHKLNKWMQCMVGKFDFKHVPAAVFSMHLQQILQGMQHKGLNFEKQ